MGLRLCRDRAGGRVLRLSQRRRPRLPRLDLPLDLQRVGGQVALDPFDLGNAALGLLAVRLGARPLGLQPGDQGVVLDLADPLDETLLGGREAGKLGQQVRPLGGALLTGDDVAGLLLHVRDERLGRERLAQRLDHRRMKIGRRHARRVAAGDVAALPTLAPKHSPEGDRQKCPSSR